MGGILSILFFLMTVTGAWRAWRNSPAFSGKATVELVVTVAGGLGAMIGGMLWILHRTQGASEAVNAGICLGIVAVATLGIIAGIILICQGRAPALPAGAPVVRMQRDKIVPWIRATALILVIGAGAAVIVPPSWTALPVTIIVLALFLAASALMPLYLTARRTDRNASALLADPWVHWQYRPEYWRAWVAARCAAAQAVADQAKSKRRWRLVVLAVLMATVPILIFGGGPLSERFIGATVCGAFMGGILALIFRANQRGPAWLDRQLSAAPAEAWLGPGGLLLGRQYLSWDISGNMLLAARVQQEPYGPCLVLRFNVYSGNGWGEVEKYVPLPEGAVDLVALQGQLRARCPKAAVAMA